jgi:hypothetical protein
MDVFDIDIGAYKEVPGAGVKGAPSVFDSPFEYDGTFWYFTGGNQGMSKSGAATVTESDETSADDAALQDRLGVLTRAKSLHRK